MELSAADNQIPATLESISGQLALAGHSEAASPDSVCQPVSATASEKALLGAVPLDDMPTVQQKYIGADAETTFANLYRLYYERLVGVIRRSFPTQDAEGIAQETYLRLHANPALYDPDHEEFRREGSKWSWLRITAVNAAISANRKQHLSIVLMDMERESVTYGMTKASMPDSPYSQVLDRSVLASIVPSLSPKLKKDLLLMYEVFGEGYTLTEISMRDDIPVGTLKSRIARAKPILEKLLLSMGLQHGPAPEKLKPPTPTPTPTLPACSLLPLGQPSKGMWNRRQIAQAAGLPESEVARLMTAAELARGHLPAIMVDKQGVPPPYARLYWTEKEGEQIIDRLKRLHVPLPPHLVPLVGVTGSTAALYTTVKAYLRKHRHQFQPVFVPLRGAPKTHCYAWDVLRQTHERYSSNLGFAIDYASLPQGETDKAPERIAYARGIQYLLVVEDRLGIDGLELALAKEMAAKIAQNTQFEVCAATSGLN